MDSSYSIILFSLAFTAFFSGIEIAFISANKLLIELKNKQGHYSARLLSTFVANPSKFISTTLVGTNIGLVVYGIYMAGNLQELYNLLVPGLQQYPFLMLLITTIASTIVVLVVGEFIPKMLFRINPDVLLRIFIYPFMLFYYLFWPLVHFITWLSKLLLNNLLRLQYNETTPVFSKIDLDEYITENMEDLDDDADVDTEIFKNALDFSNVKIRECMTPRTELVSANLQSSVHELFAKFLETGLSKILIHQGSVDHIIGYVHQKDMFKKPVSIRSVLIPIEIVPETMPAQEVLNMFTRTHRSIALVVDELGITAGIVTIEDIMEEIFGEIEDEHDVEQLTEKQISDKEYLFSARLEVDYLNNKYELDIPEGEYHTLGGYIIEQYQNFPSRGETFSIDRYEITVLSVEQTRINEVRLRVV
ncbi:MAG: hemolysin family protein [Bacteroidota bacterium]|jgi:putative hemolysin